MPRTPKPPKPDEKAQTFRLPVALWDELDSEAKTNMRSRNSELVWVLTKYFSLKRQSVTHQNTSTASAQ